jgi:hypothetical protein
MSHQAPRGRHRQPPSLQGQREAPVQGPSSPPGQYPPPGEYPPQGQYGTPYGGCQEDHYGQPPYGNQQGAYVQPPQGPPRKKHRLRKWLIIASAVFAGIIAAIVTIGTEHATGPTESWYAAGKAFAVADDQKDPGWLIGPVSELPKVCTEYLDAATPAVPGQRPSATDASADQQWLRGCEAGYHQDHPHQVVEFGIMYARGTRPCTGVCPTNWYDAGKAVALAASTSSDPYLSPRSSGTPESAATWCADLLFPEPDQPLPASVEALTQGDLPASGPEAVEWYKGCEAEYNAAQNAAPSAAPAETETPAPAATTPAVAATVDPADYKGWYQEAYDETTTDYRDGQTPAIYHESDSQFCMTTIEPSFPVAGNVPASLVGTSGDPYYAGCMAALSVQQLFELVQLLAEGPVPCLNNYVKVWHQRRTANRNRARLLLMAAAMRNSFMATDTMYALAESWKIMHHCAYMRI